MKQVFAVIGKRPVEGYSKTRLAKEVGEEAAYKLYDSFISDFFANYRRHTSKAYLYFYGAPAIKQTEEYFRHMFLKSEVTDFDFTFQKEKPFFERLADIFDDVRFKVGSETFVHLTGTDIPDFPFTHIKSQNINEADVFIGPDDDGGFYYLGSKAKHDDIFSFAKEMKENDGVFDSLVAKCEQLGLKVKVLNRWSDIDTKKDLDICLNRTDSSIIPKTVESFNKLFSGNNS